MLARQHVRPQVDVPRREPASRRTSGRSTAPASAARCTCPGCARMRARNASRSAARRGRPDQHAVAAGAVHFLDHQLGEVRRARSRRSSCRCSCQVGTLLQDRLLAEVEADHVGHVRVDRLVVGDAGADRVGERHAAGAVGREEPRHAEHRIGAERARVEEVVVDAPVDHVHALRAAGRAHVDRVVLRRTGPAPRPARRPSAARGTRARNTPSCRRRASAPRRSGCSSPAGATACRFSSSRSG